MTGTHPETVEPILHVGTFRVDVSTGEITHGESSSRLEPKMAEVLVHLARHSGEVVSKEELLDAVWPDTYVTEDALWRCIAGLRKAFGDDSRKPRFIETLPRRGYRLTAPVREEARRSSGDLHRRQKPGFLVPVILAVVLGVGAFLTAGHMDQAASPDEARDGAESATTPRQYVELARSLYRRFGREDIDRAIDLYRRALELDPDYAPAHAGLADAFSLKFLRFGRQVRWLEEAEAAAARALALGPDLPQSHKAMGLVLQAQGRFRDAIPEYRRAYEMSPKLPGTAHNLALIHLSFGELDQALRWQRQVRPEGPEANCLHLGNLATIHYLLGDLERARKHAEAALDIVPLDSYPASVLDQVDLVEGKLAAALKRSRQVAAAHPDEAFALREAGYVALVAGHRDTAPTYFESAKVAAEGNDPEATLGLAYIHWSSGRREQAEELLGESLAVPSSALWSDDDWLGRFRRAQVYAIRGETDEALAWIERAIARGFTDHRLLATLPTFAGLREDTRFRHLKSDLEERVRRMRQTSDLTLAPGR